MHEDTTKIIVGPPGTGKTTYLLKVVEDLISEKVEPHGILYLAFTRRAAQEAVTRAMRKFKLKQEDFPWFRTIHSLAFTQLGLKPKDIMSPSDYSRIGKWCGFRFTTKWSSDGLVNYQGSSPDDKVLAMEMASRASGKDLHTMWEQDPDPDIKWGMLELMQKRLLEYKKKEFKMDFVDILQKFINEGEVPPHTVLIVDEAQDLSPIQWQVIKKIGDKSRMAFIAGDDDQAIFQWAGADPQGLLNLPGQKVVLPKSFRVPAVIKTLAFNILSKIRGPRIEKQWEPVELGGEIHRVDELSQVPLHQGKWLVLCRNLYTVEQVASHCYSSNLLFEAQGNAPTLVSRDMVMAANSWSKLRTGEAITVKEAVNIYAHMSPRTGYSMGLKSHLEREDPNDVIDYAELNRRYGLLRQPATPWWHVLDRISREAISKMKELRKEADGGPLPEPTIRISTIHSAKGAEEDQVLICTDMTRRTKEAFILDPDQEHRVWYVAVTRAKRALYILKPQTLIHYEL